MMMKVIFVGGPLDGLAYVSQNNSKPSKLTFVLSLSEQYYLEDRNEPALKRRQRHHYHRNVNNGKYYYNQKN